MTTMPIRWTVKDILEKHNITPYRFWKDSGLSSKVAYAIASDEHTTVDGGVIEKVIPYLRKLTGNETQIGDILVYENDQEAS